MTLTQTTTGVYKLYKDGEGGCSMKTDLKTFRSKIEILAKQVGFCRTVMRSEDMQCFLSLDLESQILGLQVFSYLGRDYQMLRELEKAKKYLKEISG